jgi:hypothetical protein
MKHVAQLASHDPIWDTIRHAAASLAASLMPACLTNPVSSMPSVTSLPSGSARRPWRRGHLDRRLSGGL